MRVVLVSFPYAGKSTLFSAISGLPRDQLSPTEESLAAVKVPEPRLDLLEAYYKPKKRTETHINFVDLPGSADADAERAGLTRHLPTLRQADALLVVLRAFESDAVPMVGDRVDPQHDWRQLREEMLLADLLICDSRIEKLEKAVSKPTPDREHNKKELELLGRCRTALENEQVLRDVVQPGEEQKLLRSFGFLTQKPVVIAINVSEDAIGAVPALRDEHVNNIITVCAEIEAEIIQIDEADRPAFMEEYGIESLARDRIIRACYDALGLIAFLTAGEPEVRAWPVRRGATAVEAAGSIHSDLARGFIRAETIAYEDFKTAGSMRDAKAAGKVRLEPKTYVVQDGDILLIKFNV